MAGTIPLSLTQQFDEFGKPLAGGQLFLIQAGTVSTPQDGFQDSGLTIKMPYPITLDAAGRIPQFFVADGFIKVRLQDSAGVVQLASDGILVIGPTGGSGGGGTPVDPNALNQTGNIIARYGVGFLAGHVRLNGLTIGSAVSGATERAFADTQALFLYLWGADPNLVVSSGRGATAAADWAANKQLSLPDWRGFDLCALDDMGNTAANRAGIANPTTLGSAGGAAAMVLTAANLPPHTHSGVTDNENAQHTHAGGPASTQNSFGGTNSAAATGWSGPGNNTGPESVTHKHAFVTDGGSGLLATPFSLINPRKLCTFYIKL